MSAIHPDLRVACDIFRDRLRIPEGVPNEVLIGAVQRAGALDPKDLCYWSSIDDALPQGRYGEEAQSWMQGLPWIMTPCGRHTGVKYSTSSSWSRPSQVYATRSRVTCPVCLAWLAEQDKAEAAYAEVAHPMPVIATEVAIVATDPDAGGER